MRDERAPLLDRGVEELRDVEGQQGEGEEARCEGEAEEVGSQPPRVERRKGGGGGRHDGSNSPVCIGLSKSERVKA